MSDNKTDAGICEVGATVATLNTGSLDAV